MAAISLVFTQVKWFFYFAKNYANLVLFAFVLKAKDCLTS